MSYVKNKDLGSTANTRISIYGSKNTHQYNVKPTGCVFKFINNFQVY